MNIFHFIRVYTDICIKFETEFCFYKINPFFYIPFEHRIFVLFKIHYPRQYTVGYCEIHNNICRKYFVEYVFKNELAQGGILRWIFLALIILENMLTVQYINPITANRLRLKVMSRALSAVSVSGSSMRLYSRILHNLLLIMLSF